MKWPEWPLTSICRKSGFKMPVNFWLKRMHQLRWFPKWLGTTMSILFAQYSKKSLVAHPESFKKYIVGDHERNKKVSSEQLRKKRVLNKAFYGSINNYRRRFCYVERNSTQSEYENVLTRGGWFVKMIRILLLNKWRQTIFNQQNAPAFGDVRKWLWSGSWRNTIKCYRIDLKPDGFTHHFRRNYHFFCHLEMV